MDVPEAEDLKVSELHQRTGTVLRRVRQGAEYTIVDRWGDPVARIVPVRVPVSAGA